MAAAPTISDVHVSSRSGPFAGDGRLLATVSPNGDGFRDRAVVRFRLDRPAQVRLEAVRTDTIHPGKVPQAVVWRTERRFAAGRRLLAWRPARTTPPRRTCWYVSGAVRRVDLRRPYLDFGVPFRFRDWDLDFVGWLNRTDKRVGSSPTTTSSALRAAPPWPAPTT